jgi:PhoPQ-activated pathogenicity-related protein
VLGYRFTENKQREEEFYRLKNLSLRVLNIFANPILLIARFNERIEKFTYKYMNSYYKPMQDLFDFIDEKIKERIETEDVHESMDMVDAFLMEKARQKRLNLSTADLYT